MSACIIRSGVKSRHSAFNLWPRQSITDSIGAPTVRSQRQLQHSNAHTRFPHSPYGKPKNLSLCPSVVLSSPISSTTSSASKVGFVSKIRFVGWYLGMVKSRPILTKSITAAFIYTAADLSSQMIAQPSSEPYDLVRTLRMAGYGMLILGPSVHFWFNFVSKALPQRDLITTLKKIVLGQTIYGPAMTVVFFSVNAGLQGETGAEIVGRLKRDLIPTMINGVMYWPICDFVTFKFIPVHLQVCMDKLVQSSNGFKGEDLSLKLS
ncbi:unnamed protein product [Ilex paraguariensis]|uniref:PXMP2/4 family protein 4 n=1 Tax=Ilex paraguariensis TaxID=185542 RepID=A0ABC8SCT4_9AQUA